MKTLILIAAFQSYGGRLMNYANETMLYLKQLQKDHPEIEIQSCKPLTVSTSRALPEVMKCLEKVEVKKKKKVDFLIVLGESPNCQITLETDAANFFDSKGERVASQNLKPGKINLNGDNWRKGTVPFDQLYCQYKKTVENQFADLIPVTVGPSVNNTFVCNLLNYELAGETLPPYGFIHLPSLGCKYENNQTKFIRPPQIAERMLSLFSGLTKKAACEEEDLEFNKLHHEKWQLANDALLKKLN